MPAPKGNKYTQKYDFDKAFELFEEALEFSKTKDCLCVQDAISHIDIPVSTFYKMQRDFEVLANIKEMIDANIVARINKGALLGDMNPTASIWRMKQLGETDKLVTENTNKNIDIPIIDFVDNEDTE